MKMIESIVGTQLVTRFLFAQQDHDDEDDDEDDHDDDVGDDDEGGGKVVMKKHLPCTEFRHCAQ